MISLVIFRIKVYKNFKYYFRLKSKSKPGSTQLRFQENPIKKISLNVQCNLEFIAYPFKFIND